MGKAKLDATSQRWKAELADYDFSLVYRNGKSNIDTDSLSRIDYDHQELFSDAVKAICEAILVSSSCTPAESICMSQTLEGIVDKDDPELEAFSDISWVVEQKKDEDIARALELKRAGHKPTKREIGKQPLGTRKLLYDWDKLVIKKEVLYRVSKLNDETIYQLILPAAYRDIALRGLHDDAGHQGRDRTLYLVNSRFYWPGMNKDVEGKVANCPNCILRKTKSNRFAELVSIETSQPFDMICIDFLCLEQSKGGYENILVITDHFTRYAQAIPTRNQTAQTTARCLWEFFIQHYSFPARIHSDQGPESLVSFVKLPV